MKHEEFIEKCIEIVIESENEGLDPKEHYLTKKVLKAVIRLK